MGQSLQKIKYNLNGKTVTVQTFANDDGRIDGYCFSEGVYIPDPYGEPKTTKDIPPPKEKTQDEIDTELAEVSSYQFLPLEAKKLSYVQKLFQNFTALLIALQDIHGYQHTGIGSRH